MIFLKLTKIISIVLLIGIGVFRCDSQNRLVDTENTKKDNLKIGAYYYPWYDTNRHWDEGYKRTPILGKYRSRDPEIIRKHITWASEYGIDFFMMSWWGPDSWEDVTIRDYFLKSKDVKNIRFGILYESLGRIGDNTKIDFNDPKTTRQLIEDFKYLSKTYFSHKQYLKIDNKPVVFVYLTRIFDGDYESAITELRAEIKEEGYELYLIGDQVYWQSPYEDSEKKLMTLFDAVTPYNMHTSIPGIEIDFVKKVSNKYQEWFEVANGLDVDFVPNVMPGFDDTAVRPEAKHPVIPRDTSQFRYFCEEARQYLSDKNMILITSWNEWHEDTQIEPDEEDSESYLDVIRKTLVGPNYKITVASLLEEMTDLDRLTQTANYTSRQFSSYDRESHKPEGWFANDDAGRYLRKEENEFILAEAQGPGVIVRIWSANPRGILRIYLDGKLALEEDFEELLTGQVEPFLPPFGARRAEGCNLYFPFPYAESMKVTCSRGGQYYHVNTRTYPKGTKVKTYSRDQIGDLPELTFTPYGEVTERKRLQGPGVVRRLEVQLPENPDKLREKTIQITVDGKLCVWSPLGDFFGTAPGRTTYTSMPMGITEEGVGYCNFPMPFRKSFRVNVDVPVKLWITRDSRPFRFHAWWRGNNALRSRPLSDWPVLYVEGTGRLVGTFLAVRNPIEGWWGEGDEKIYIDGEKFPSTFGTGTEDYFGYAWGSTELFQAPYHNQTRCDGPEHRGQTAVARYHILDDIPFQSSICFDMEIWHWHDVTMGYSTVAYWYALPGSKHDFKRANLRDRKIIEVPKMPSEEVTFDSRFVKVTDALDETHMAQRLSIASFEISRDEPIVWHGAIPGDVFRIVFESPVEENRLILGVSMAYNLGIVRVTVNGQPAFTFNSKAEIGAYDPDLTLPTGEIELSNVPINNGFNELRIEIVRENRMAKSMDYLFRLEYLRIP